MKKLAAFILIIALVLSFGTFAYADTTEIDDSGFGIVKPIRKNPKTKEIKTIVDVCDLDVLSDSNEAYVTSDVQIGDWEDVDGNVWGNAVKFWVVERQNYSNKENIVFDLDGDYEDFYGIVAFSPDSDKGAKMFIRVYVDGKKQYESDNVMSSSEVIEFSVPVKGANKLKIECVTHSSKFGYCIVDGCVTK